MSDIDAKWLELVAAGKAEWSPGMRGHDRGKTFVVISATPNSYTVRFDLPPLSPRRTRPVDLWRFELRRGPPALPDWDHDGTRGELLGQVRKRWDDPYMVAEYWRGPRIWTCKSGRVHFCGVAGPKGKTEAAALLAALEAAP